MEERRSPTDSEKQASAWLVRLKSSDVTSTERGEFADWLAATPDNQSAYSAIEATWDRLGALPGLGTPRPPTRFPRRPAVAVAALCVVAALATILIVRSPLVDREPQVVSSVVGQHLSTTLPDGSTVVLNSRSRLSIEFSVAERRVRLGEGEALFNVVSAPNRPFIVETRLGAVQVRGTSFVVRVTDTSTRATVLHGVVEGRRFGPQSAVLWPSRTKEASPLLVATAGEEITFLGTSASLASITPETSSRRLAWREGMLAFDGETLAEATAEVTRQTGVSFEFRDPALKHLQIGGYIKADDPEAFSDLLRSNLGLSVTKLSETRIQIARK